MKTSEITMGEIRKLLIEKMTKIIDKEELKQPWEVQFSSMEVDKFQKEDDEFLTIEIDGHESFEKDMEKRSFLCCKLKDKCWASKSTVTGKTRFTISVEQIFDELHERQ